MASAVVRDVVFVSHANPEDNRFAEWLALHLARAGYKVWSDVTRLLCGEDFWNVIEDTLRTRTIKFVFVSSRASQAKDGVKKELHLADTVRRQTGLKDFILPIAIDDMPFGDSNIEILRLNIASFQAGWAHGLVQLIKKLEEDNVPKSPHAGPDAVRRWWETYRRGQARIVEREESCFTNWFPFLSNVDSYYRASVSPAHHEKLTAPGFRLPVHAVGQQVLTLSQDFDPPFERVEKLPFNARSLDDQRLRTRLLRLAWERAMDSRGLQRHPLANGRACHYFTTGKLPNDEIPFARDGVAASRQVIGYKTVGPRDRKRKRYWHYAIEGFPLFRPAPALCIRGHLLFSDDGKTLWESDTRMNAARRNQVRNGWWNDSWRDRMLAVMNWLADSGGTISLATGVSQVIYVSALPERVLSPVSYDVVPEALAEPEAWAGVANDEEDEDLTESEEAADEVV